MLRAMLHWNCSIERIGGSAGWHVSIGNNFTFYPARLIAQTGRFLLPKCWTVCCTILLKLRARAERWPTEIALPFQGLANK
jgi:hypothetical protein